MPNALVDRMRLEFLIKKDLSEEIKQKWWDSNQDRFVPKESRISHGKFFEVRNFPYSKPTNRVLIAIKTEYQYPL